MIFDMHRCTHYIILILLVIVMKHISPALISFLQVYIILYMYRPTCSVRPDMEARGNSNVPLQCDEIVNRQKSLGITAIEEEMEGNGQRLEKAREREIKKKCSSWRSAQMRPIT